VAATLQEAIDDVVRDIGAIGTSVPDVNTRMGTWLASAFTGSSAPGVGNEWQRDNALQRSAYDWSVETSEARAAIAALEPQIVPGPEVQQANIAIGVVSRFLLAVQQALAGGRVTAGQVTAIVADYTIAFE